MNVSRENIVEQSKKIYFWINILIFLVRIPINIFTNTLLVKDDIYNI
jgi:hypothetical protein